MFVLLALLALFAIVLALVGVPPIAVPVGLFGVVASGLVLYRRSRSIREAVDGLDTRTLIAIHAVRAPIGVGFLVLHAYGALPAAFAVRGGIGDIVAGLAALFVLSASRRVKLAWNVVGLLDLAMVVATAQKLAFVDHDPLMRAAVGRFPFPLLPFFVVPLLVLSHLALFARTRRDHFATATKKRASLRATRSKSVPLPPAALI